MLGDGEDKVTLDDIANRNAVYKPKESYLKMIKEYIEAKCSLIRYIIQIKRNFGLPIYDVPNEVEELKQPKAEKEDVIKDAFRHFSLYES